MSTEDTRPDLKAQYPVYAATPLSPHRARSWRVGFLVGACVALLATARAVTTHRQVARHLDGLIQELGQALLEATATSIEASLAASDALDQALDESVRAKATFLSDTASRAPRLLDRFARAAGLQHVLVFDREGHLLASARDVPSLGSSDDPTTTALASALERAARELMEQHRDREGTHVQRWAVPAAGLAPSLAVVRPMADGATAILVQNDARFAAARRAADATRQANALASSPRLVYVCFEAPAPTSDPQTVLALETSLKLPSGRDATLRVGVDRTPVSRALAVHARSAWLQGALLVLLVTVAAAYLWYLLDTRRRLRARVERDERLAALGRLAAHVAHEVRNPLNAIGLGVQRLQRSNGDGNVRQITGTILEEVARLDRTVQEVLQSARPRPPRWQSTPAIEFAATLRELAAPVAAARNIRLNVDAPHGLTLEADTDLVRGAVWNLVRNACEASPDGGDVSVRIRAVGAHARITVGDRGAGLSDTQRAHAFEPFASGRRGGTGLGLALTLAAAQAHGGTVEIEPRDGGGSLFHFVWPFPEERTTT